ncbi:MAG: hypothetical protein HND52_13095 [Ignavibacteriae bacterium]|nr:hypothetical protein [Ignavibacteriota bacterium]NOG98888.1 hypothetical protein [Ignavibacteriota bacterium]
MLQELNYSRLKNTRDTIQQYAQVLSDVKSTFTPHLKNWEEHALSIYAKGLTTTPIPIELKDRVDALDLNLNFQEHKLKMFFGSERLSVNLENQSIERFALEVESLLNKIGISYNLPPDKFNEKEAAEYRADEVKKIWSVIRFIYFVLQKFKGEQLLETSSINFWAHHFDLALLLFSGNLIPGKDPDDWDNSREQMNFGFSFGDEGIAEPYFSITAFPFNSSIISNDLPYNAYWHTEDWSGAILKYDDLRQSANPQTTLLEFISAVKKLNF